MKSFIQEIMLISMILSGIHTLNAASIAMPVLPKGIKNLTVDDRNKFIDNYRKTSTLLTSKDSAEGTLTRSNARQLHPESLAETIDHAIQEDPEEVMEILGETQAEIDFIKVSTRDLGYRLQRAFDMYRLPAVDAPLMTPETKSRAAREEDAKQKHALEEAQEEIKELKAQVDRQRARINQLEVMVKKINNERATLKKTIEDMLAGRAQ